ncbi:unnamed protein product [Onchocerca flexuosa]|uniref:Uncharacterized protein n=1 Tax=Onchocerca flexuosa TaxID=387005 RepID=A0A183HMT2_9BILA|nr:unnamed protein product [Onchocerca flexuosa]
MLLKYLISQNTNIRITKMHDDKRIDQKPLVLRHLLSFCVESFRGIFCCICSNTFMNKNIISRETNCVVKNRAEYRAKDKGFQYMSKSSF